MASGITPQKERRYFVSIKECVEAGGGEASSCSRLSTIACPAAHHATSDSTSPVPNTTTSAELGNSMSALRLSVHLCAMHQVADQGKDVSACSARVVQSQTCWCSAIRQSELGVRYVARGHRCCARAQVQAVYEPFRTPPRWGPFSGSGATYTSYSYFHKSTGLQHKVREQGQRHQIGLPFFSRRRGWNLWRTRHSPRHHGAPWSPQAFATPPRVERCVSVRVPHRHGRPPPPRRSNQGHRRHR